MRRALPYLFPLLTLALVVAASVLLWRAGSVREMDRPLPALPIAALDGGPIARAAFDGRPWVINVWMPG